MARDQKWLISRIWTLMDWNWKSRLTEIHKHWLGKHQSCSRYDHVDVAFTRKIKMIGVIFQIIRKAKISDLRRRLKINVIKFYLQESQPWAQRLQSLQRVKSSSCAEFFRRCSCTAGCRGQGENRGRAGGVPPVRCVNSHYSHVIYRKLSQGYTGLMSYG